MIRIRREIPDTEADVRADDPLGARLVRVNYTGVICRALRRGHRLGRPSRSCEGAWCPSHCGERDGARWPTRSSAGRPLLARSSRRLRMLRGGVSPSAQCADPGEGRQRSAAGCRPSPPVDRAVGRGHDQRAARSHGRRAGQHPEGNRHPSAAGLGCAERGKGLAPDASRPRLRWTSVLDGRRKDVGGSIRTVAVRHGEIETPRP